MNPESPRRATAPQSFPNLARRRAIAADHPSLAGHFPSNPIVPGVVILEEVMRAFEEWRPGSRVAGMPVVKFLAPLRPEQGFTIRFSESCSNRVGFECTQDDGQLFVRGELILSDAGDRGLCQNSSC